MEFKLTTTKYIIGSASRIAIEHKHRHVCTMHRNVARLGRSSVLLKVVADHNSKGEQPPHYRRDFNLSQLKNKTVKGKNVLPSQASAKLLTGQEPPGTGLSCKDRSYLLA